MEGNFHAADTQYWHHHCSSQKLTLIAIVIAKFSAMARVMAVDGIARSALGDQTPVCVQDVGMRWVGVLSIIEKKGDVLSLSTLR